MTAKPRTLFEKIWDEHVVYDEPGRQTIYQLLAPDLPVLGPSDDI